MPLHHQTECECDIAEIVGPYAWGVIHHAFETFPCAPCAENGGKLGRGVHDVVNFHRGEPVQHPEDLEFLREAVMEVPPQRSSSPLELEVLRLAGEAGIMERAKFPKCTPAAGRKFERCVRQVKKGGTADSPQSVCTVSVGCSPRSKRK